MRGSVDIDDIDLVALAEQDPVSCLDRCSAILTKGDPASSAVALWASGVARRTLGEIEQSALDLEAACLAFETIGDIDMAAESTISLAASVAVAGEIDAAVALLDDVIASNEMPWVRAHVWVQKAGIIARVGDLGQALELFGLAEPILQETGDSRWQALLHSSRGLVRAYTTDFDGAEEDLRAAHAIYQEMGREASAAEMIYNLGFVAVERGDIARGLALYLDAERMFDDLGMPSNDLRADRAHAYMLAGLPGPARELAVDAAGALLRSGEALQQTEATYLAAQAAIAERDLANARSLACQAMHLAEGQKRPVWRLLAQVILEDARWRSGESVDDAGLERLATDLATSGLVSAASHARLVAALAAIDREDFHYAESQLGAVDAAANLDLPVELLQGLARGRLALSTGDLDGARAAFCDAAAAVDSSKATLSATESRAGVSRLSEEIADAGIAAYAGHPRATVAWLERFRGASLRAAPVVSNKDRQIADLLARLRALRVDIDQMIRDGEDPRGVSTEVAEIEKTIRDRALAVDAVSGERQEQPSLAKIVASLGETRLLYLYQYGGKLQGTVFGASSQSEVEVADVGRVSALKDHLASDIRRAFLYPSQADPARVGAAMAELGHIIFGSVPQGERWVIVPPPELIALPWNALAHAVWPGAEVVVSPSAWMWYHAGHQPRRSGTSVVVAGAGLANASAEGLAVASFMDEPTMLVGAGATVESAIGAIDGASLLHVVAHTRLRTDNPMFSSLELADGLLNLYDIEGVGIAPETVVLSACDSAHGSVVSGYDMYGLTSLLLGAGTRSILATVAPIPDSEKSIEAVRRIHRELALGASGSAALAKAIDLSSEGGVDPSVAFVAYGA